MRVDLAAGINNQFFLVFSWYVYADNLSLPQQGNKDKQVHYGAFVKGLGVSSLHRAKRWEENAEVEERRGRPRKGRGDPSGEERKVESGIKNWCVSVCDGQRERERLERWRVGEESALR